MSDREVTKDDVGKECEFFFQNTHGMDGWQKGTLAAITDIKDKDGDNVHFLIDGEFYLSNISEARIRTSPLPDGWLPDDWRVLGDEEVCNKYDSVVYKSTPLRAFSEYKVHFKCRGTYTGQTARSIVSGVSGNLCVIRPRWRPATKDDIGKTVYSKDGSEAVMKIVVDADSCGYDVICMSQMPGWCFSKLCDLKVENEGWHVN